MTEHLVNIFPKPAPESVRPQHLSRANAWLDLWNRHIGDPGHSSEGDYEDFFEQAARLDAALRGFGPENTWIRVMRPSRADTAVNAGTGRSRPVVELAHLPKYGAQPGSVHTPADLEQEKAADRYHLLRSFQHRAGRRMMLGGYATGGPDDAIGLIVQMLADGVRNFFVKGFPSKTGIWQFSLPGGATPDQIHEALLSSEEHYGLFNLEGRPGSMLIQERIRMSHEYRFFIVDGIPVTGAGCIEEFTPLDNEGDRFDPRFRAIRSTDDPPAVEPALLRWLRAYAAAAAGDFAAEGLHTYVLDVALGPDGTPLVVEVNGMLNSGLYASDPCQVTAALAGSVETAA